MSSWKRTRPSQEEAKNMEKWKQHEVPVNVLCHSSGIPKLKLQSLKKVQENSIPVLNVCDSLTNSTLATPVKGAQRSIEPMLRETPVKPLQKRSVTPSNNPIVRQLFTPECTSHEDIRATISLSPVQIPITIESHSPIGSSLCVALGEPFKTKNVSSTPRSSSHKSVSVLKSHKVPENEEITEEEKADNLKSLEDSSTKLTLSDKSDTLQEFVSRTWGSSSGTSDLSKEETDTYDLLPPTQPYESIILEDVTAYVEIISKNEDFSAGVGKELVKLGATVVPAFNRDVPVTHVVFNDGNISTYKKAMKRNIPLVSVLWIEACRKAGVKVNESLFPPYQIERYESPDIRKVLKKRKIMRFYSDEKQRPSPRLRKGVIHNETPVQSSTETSDQSNAVRESACAPKWVDEVAGGNGRVRMLVKMTGISETEFKELVNRPPTPDSDIELEETSPLPVRLLRKFAKNLPAANSTLNILDGTSKSMETSNIAASFSNEASYENYFAKKLIEVERMEKHMEIGDMNEEISVSVVNVTSQGEHSNMSNVSQTRKVSKQKLLKIRKKRKSEIKQLDRPEINGLDDDC